jgi:glycine cleavage system aminomethyltransferase T
MANATFNSSICTDAGKGFYIAVGGAIGEHGFAHIQNALQDRRFNCRLTDCTDDMVMISIQGPKRFSILPNVSTAKTKRKCSAVGHFAKLARDTFLIQSRPLPIHFEVCFSRD